MAVLNDRPYDDLAWLVIVRNNNTIAYGVAAYAVCATA
jgi:hypothetical protein